MDYEIRALSVASTDNIHTLKGKIFIPKGEIKGLFHIVHGMTEYIGRYDYTAVCQAGEWNLCNTEHPRSDTNAAAGTNS